MPTKPTRNETEGANLSRRKVCTVFGAALISGCSQRTPENSTETHTSVSQTSQSTSTDKNQTTQSTTSADEHPPKEIQVDKPWPQYRLNSQNTGHTNTKGPTNSPTQYWEHEFSEEFRFVEPPVFDEEHLYIPNYGGKEIAVLNPLKGTKQRVFNLTSQIKYSPSIVNGILYAPSSDFVVAIDTSTDHRQWKAELSEEVGPITVANSTVFAGIASGTPALATALHHQQPNQSCAHRFRAV